MKKTQSLTVGAKLSEIELVKEYYGADVIKKQIQNIRKARTEEDGDKKWMRTLA